MHDEATVPSMGLYLLDNSHTPIPCDDVLTWAASMESVRIVKQERIGTAFVSTVFLGIDHGFGRSPAFFETMIFEHPRFQGYQERHGTWDEALAGHAAAVETVRASLSAEAADTTTEKDN